MTEKEYSQPLNYSRVVTSAYRRTQSPAESLRTTAFPHSPLGLLSATSSFGKQVIHLSKISTYHVEEAPITTKYQSQGEKEFKRKLFLLSTEGKAKENASMKCVTLCAQQTHPSSPSPWAQEPILRPAYPEERKVPLSVRKSHPVN